MACISVVLSPLCPNISTTLPIGFLACSGHSVNLHHSLISAFTTFQRFFRNKYVVGQRLKVLGEQESKILTHLQPSDKRPVAPFEISRPLAPRVHDASCGPTKLLSPCLLPSHAKSSVRPQEQALLHPTGSRYFYRSLYD